MKIKECIKLAGVLLNLGDVLKSTTLTDTDKLLVRCANNCINEIASEYLPLIDEKTVRASGGKIMYSSLGTTIYDVIDVKFEGRKAEFELMPSFIRVKKDRNYTVKFCYCPSELTAEDNVPMSLLVTGRIIAYGIAAEYMLINGFYEEAVTFDRVFKDALIRAAYGKKERRVKSRRWLI